MLYSLKNLWRRKTRTILTILGIVIGIIALTVLGSLASRMTSQVKGNRSWFVDGISVTPGSVSGMQTRSRGYFEASKAVEVEAVPGVRSVNVDLSVPLELPGAADLTIVAQGMDLSRTDKRVKNLKIAAGRHLEDGETGKTVIGSNISESLGVEAGGSIKLNGVDLEVVGVLEATLSVPDRIAFVSIENAREILSGYFPDSRLGTVANSIRAFPEVGIDPADLAETIEGRVSGVNVRTPEEAEKDIAQFTFIFNAIILGVALIALVVGGLSVINTMVMAVSERKREIGVKKAIGADTSAILGEIMMESSLIGFFGGLIGVMTGTAIVLVLNSLSIRNEVTVFTITPFIVVGPVLFATVLGIAAGFFPALRAARLDPVDALSED
ncbi:MAG: ABC transporter permease [Actinobacteria bacterium]|nr:ABC transporter permease [Actinomycetota bacterium]